MHEGGGRWVGSNKVVELKKKKKKISCICRDMVTNNKIHAFKFETFGK